MGTENYVQIKSKVQIITKITNHGFNQCACH